MLLSEYISNKDNIIGPILFTYFWSSSSWWIRAQLEIKLIKYTEVIINLSTGEHLTE